MFVYLAEHVIYGDFVYKIWDEEMIKHLLSFFIPDNMRIDILSKFIDKSKGNYVSHTGYYSSIA